MDTALGDETFDVVVGGDIDLANSHAIRNLLVAAVGCSTETRVLVDVREVTFIDSMGLSAFVVARNLGLKKGCDIVLYKPQPRILTTLAVSGLDQVFTIIR